jgi:hypothetical protein
MFKRLLFVLIAASCLTSLQAQTLGIGGQFGDPTGLSVRLNNQGGINYDILASWDFDDYFFLNVHGLWDKSLMKGPNLSFFYGPGIFLGIRDREQRDDDVIAGLSGSLGLSLYFNQKLELFAQVNPRLVLIDETDGDVGGGIGLRFYIN